MTRDELRDYQRRWANRHYHSLSDPERAVLADKQRAYLARPEVRARELQRSRARTYRPRSKAENHRNNLKQRSTEKWLLFQETWRAFHDWVKSIPCMDCGGSFPPCAMDFDHRDPSTKSSVITFMRFGRLARYQREVMKCDLVCANCHRIRTHARRLLKKGQESAA